MQIAELPTRREMAEYLAKFDVSERMSRGFYESKEYARNDEPYLVELYTKYAINIEKQYIKARKKDMKYQIINTFYGTLMWYLGAEAPFYQVMKSKTDF